LLQKCQLLKRIEAIVQSDRRTQSKDRSVAAAMPESPKSVSPVAAVSPHTSDPSTVVQPAETAVPAGEQIEVDQGDTDNDSAFGDDA
jgi:hypothetical protein